MARALAGSGDVDPILSFAGRTENPVPPPVPYRTGGFGGPPGLAAFLRDQAIGAVVDATHPFAARISANAVPACHDAGVPLVVYTRPAWTAEPGDQWVRAADIGTAVLSLRDLSSETPPHTSVILSRSRSDRVEERTTVELDTEAGSVDALRLSTRALRARLRMMGWKDRPLSVFLTTGRLDLARFGAAPQHRYLIRTIDPPDPAELPPNATVLLARPPFTVADETALMRRHGIDLLVTKNSGGTASAAKLVAARKLGLPVLMIERPPPSGTPELHDLGEVLAWISGQALA